MSVINVIFYVSQHNNECTKNDKNSCEFNEKHNFVAIHSLLIFVYHRFEIKK